MTKVADIENKEVEPSSFKLIFALAIAGLLSGIILVATYLYTDPLIIANREKAIQRAIFQVLPDCSNYETLIFKDGKLIKKEEGSQQQDKDSPLIYAGYGDENEFVGFAIPGSEPGFQDLISAIYGYDVNSEIIMGFEVLESKETPGLGDKIFKDADFQTNFNQLSVKPQIVTVKKGEKTKENQVEAITGATISSKAVVKLLNNSVEFWDRAIEEYLVDNNLKNTLGSND